MAATISARVISTSNLKSPLHNSKRIFSPPFALVYSKMSTDYIKIPMATDGVFIK